MSSFLREEVFDWLLSSVKLSNNSLFNWILSIILYTVLCHITFKMVGELYNSNTISGSCSGKVFHLILFIVDTFITAAILRLIKGIIWLCNYISVFPIWVWSSLGGVVILVTIFLLLKKNDHREHL